MRIVILADPIDNQTAGVHVYTRALVEGLIKYNRGHEIVLLREKRDPNLKGVRQIIIPNTQLPIGLASLRLFIIIPLIIKFIKADVVIEPAHFGPFNIPYSIKRITVIHDLTPILFPELHRWHSQFLQNTFLKSILNATDLIVANSNHTLADIIKTYPGVTNKVIRIYPGVANTMMNNDSSSDVLKKHQITTPYFLFTGTVEPRKNLTILLEAFRLLNSNSQSDMQLVIAGGKGWKSETFYAALQDHPYKDKIICTGYVSDADLNVLYKNASTFIYPSLYEGFGLPVLEAMRYGTPVIVSNVSSLPEVGGNAVLYFDPASAHSLAEKMKIMQSDDIIRKQLSSDAVIQASKFTHDKFSNEFWDAIENIYQSNQL